MSRLAEKAAMDAFFLGSALREFRLQHEIDEKGLAAFLCCEFSALSRLALCRRPDHCTTEFASEVAKVAEFAGCDSLQLVRLLRETSAIRALRGNSDMSATESTLLAARDRRLDDDGESGEETGQGERDQ